MFSLSNPEISVRNEIASQDYSIGKDSVFITDIPLSTSEFTFYFILLMYMHNNVHNKLKQIIFIHFDNKHFCM